MVTFGETFECPFCVLSAEGRSPVWDHFFQAENGDEVIFRSDSFSVVLDTAPLAEGHVLIITDRHMSSLAGLSKTEREKLRVVKRDAESKLRDVYGPITYFEHGAESFARHAGACIDHAHLHLVPGDVDIFPLVAHDYPNVESFTSYENALESLAGRPYLLFGRDTGPVYGAHAPACSTQYLRRLVSQAAGSKAAWNWRDCVRWADALSVRDQLLNARNKLRA
jgi:diadenosine tetraphosphate (Ap4A) HIT family hydrolase